MSSVAAEIAPPATPSRLAERNAAPHGELALFHHGLADLCRANVPLPRALRILHVDLERGPLARHAAAMADEIEAGTPLAEAYGRCSFSPVYRALVEAGVTSGALPDVLDEIAIHASQRARSTDRMRRALAYPLVAASFVIVIGALLTFFVAPIERQFPIGGTSGTSSPTAGIAAWTGLGIALLVVAVGIAVAMLRSPLDEGVGPAGIVFRLPLIGRMRLLAGKSGFAGTLALLLRRSMPLPAALELTARATKDREIRAHVARMAAAAHAGDSLAQSIGRGSLVSPSLAWFLEATSTERGAADALDDIAAIYRQRLERTAERVAVLAAPLAQVLIGVVVLGFALAYTSAAFQSGRFAGG